MTTKLTSLLSSTKQISGRNIVEDNVMPNNNNINFDWYIAGFVDGEGCFSVSFRKLGRLKLGIEVRPSFSISQRKTDINYELLARIAKRFKGGAIRVDRYGKVMYKYETRSLDHIRKHVIPFFQRFPLQGEKLLDFSIFCKICSLVAAKHHLNLSGLTTIIDLAEGMNTSGKRRIALSSLRDLLKRSQ